MTRLHSLVCFQTFPFPCCHFLSHKRACIVFPAVKHSGDARRLTATCTSALSYNTALQPGPTSLPALPAPCSTTPASSPLPVRRTQERSCLISWQGAGEKKHSLSAQVCSLVQSQSRVATCWQTHPQYCVATLTSLTKEGSQWLPELMRDWIQRGKVTLALYPHCPTRSCGFGMPSRRGLYLCLGKKFRLFQGSRILCSLGNHLPSLTDTG